MNLFSVDSPLYKFMSRFLDMLKLNAMWLLCSLPIVTMGAASTAAYTITLKMVDDQEGYIAAPFWREFKANLKKGSIIGIIRSVAVYAIYLDIQLYQKAERYNTMFLIVAIVAIFMLVMHMIYAFPLLARYENTIVNTLRNSYSIAAKFLGRTFFLLTVLCFEVIFFLWNSTTMYVGILLGPACLILTVSGFARQFFRVIEQENDVQAEEEKAAAREAQAAEAAEKSKTKEEEPIENESQKED